MEYNVYCDESCHLENDQINVMSIGAVWCPTNKIKEINSRIVEIKQNHGVFATSELKWTKVGPVKSALYQDIICYFFDDHDLHFRGLIIPNKEILDHKRFSQTHNDWYYKMYFDMLKVIFSPEDTYNVYIDIKDSHSSPSIKELHKICCNSAYDFSARIIKKMQPIRSHEVQIMQIVDVLTGAIAYQNRKFSENFTKSSTKSKIIDLIQKKSNYTLSQTTLYRENKLNLLVWESTKEGQQ